MKPAHLGSDANPALEEVRRQLAAGLGERPTGPTSGVPPAPPSSPATSRPPSPRPAALEVGVAPLDARFDGTPVPRRPVATTSPTRGASLLALQMSELSGVPAAPPLPPPPPSVLASAPPRAATPAEVMARPANAGRTAAGKMELFVQPSFRPLIATLAADPTYSALFTELAARPPANIASVLHQVCANEALRQAAPAIAARVAEGRAQDSNVPGELIAGRVAGYQVHPHTFAGEGTDRATIDARLTAQFGRDAAMVREAFVAARDSGQLDTFYGSFEPMNSASCHAVRMNAVMAGLGTITERRDAAEANPFDGSRAWNSSAVLQAAYALGDDEAAIRGALAARRVPRDGIDAIIAGLQAASLL